jgi:glycosyltransferase involved in cell wall biosynthesis
MHLSRSLIACISMKAVFAVCVRNVAPYLPAVLANLERMGSIYDEAGFIFVENDSDDGTRSLLQRWCARRSTAHLIWESGIVHRFPPRTVRLAWARNQYLIRIKAAFADFDHMIVADGDEVNAEPIEIDGFRAATAFLDATPNCAAVFANQDGIYYDMWALRHKKLCPNDIWEETFDAVRRNGWSDQEAYQRTFVRRVFSLNRKNDPVHVESAFGGLGIYRIKSVLKNTRGYHGFKPKSVRINREVARIGWQRCEHVAFHEGFAQSGQRLFIVPSLINAKTGPAANFNPFFPRSLVFDLSTITPLSP